MNIELVSPTEQCIRDLVAEFAQSWKRTLDLAIQLGDALKAHKASLPRGEWLSWLERSFPLGERMARNFMDLASNRQEIADLPAETTLTAALEWLQQQRRALRRASSPIDELRADGLVIPASCQVEVGDSRQLPLADESVALVVTSPPYNARVNYDVYEDWLDWPSYWDGLLLPALRECYRVLMPGGRLCLNIANVIRENIEPAYASDDVRERWAEQGVRKWAPPGANGQAWATLVDRHLLPALEDVGFLLRERLMWVKAEDATAVVSQSTAWGSWCSATNPVLRAIAEPIFVCSKLSYAREPGDSDLEPDDFKAWTRNAWFIPPPPAAEQWGNPAAFPVELPRRLIKLYSYPGDLVVDPFCGSGTTLVAAARTGRFGYGCDISEQSVARARARLGEEVAA